MADESLTVKGINWRQTFPFINLFRAFRVAVHPSKLVLALVALILLYLTGNCLDLAWPIQSRAIADEPAAYEAFSTVANPGISFTEFRAKVRGATEEQYARVLQEQHIVSDPKSAAAAAHEGSHLSELKNKLIAVRRDEIDAAKKLRDTDLKDAQKKSTADRDYQNAVREAYARTSSEYGHATHIKNYGLFDVFFGYQANQISNIVRGVRDWNWFGEENPAAAMNPLGASAIFVGSPGVVQSITRFLKVGPMWLLTQHWVYFTLMGTIFLVIWSVFGGAICRIAAVHVARDEKLSIRSALMFSSGKFLSFLFAPIIPLLIVVGVGLLVTVGSSVAGIPYVGPILVGLLFVLALAAGFLMALVLLGLIGGFNLMYPTVAVEGSDSFDAISRSFSYLYARPWRLGFYSLVSIIYGAASYIFVRFFILMMLALTHRFAGLAVFGSADSAMPLWTSLWPSPSTAGRLSYDIDSLGLSFSQEIGARLIWLWVHLVVAMLGAFAICFYFSSSTIIYYLMRREVDATDLDDVYLEQPDDEFADPVSEPPIPPSSEAVVVSESPTS